MMIIITIIIEMIAVIVIIIIIIIIARDWREATEVLICAAQVQALRTTNVKFDFDKSIQSPSLRLTGKTGESVSHIVRECSALAQQECKRSYENVG